MLPVIAPYAFHRVGTVVLYVAVLYVYGTAGIVCGSLSVAHSSLRLGLFLWQTPSST